MFWFDTICVTASWLRDCRLLLLYVIVLVIEWLWGVVIGVVEILPL
jgi:hypothetical protein